MRFFNLDLHASVIKDLTDIFERIGHNVSHWSISSHAWVHGEKTRDVEVVNQYTWRHLNEHMCERFYQRYRELLSEYDGFIVTHTPAFALLYLRFNKPVIVVASTRYEAPFSLSKRNWEWLNSSLRELSERKLICRVANNKYDQQYCELFTGLSWGHIPSLCYYFGEKWNPVTDRFLVDSKVFPARLKSVNLVFKKSLGRFSWSDLIKYAGIIVIPYNVSVMSVFEYYQAAIPLFFPSKEFCMELYSNFSGEGVLSELSWLQVHGVNGGSVLYAGQNDPNDYGNMSVMEQWINYSDWYDSEWMPHITYFKSFSELEEQIRSADLKGISDKMRRHNVTRKIKIETLWSQQLNTLINI